MKKKILALLIVTSLLMIVATGCFKADVDVRVNLLGQVSVKALLIVANNEDGTPMMDVKAMLNMASPTLLDDLQERGFTVTDYNQDGYTGLVIENKNIDWDKMKFEGDNQPQVDFTLKLEGDKIIFDLPLTFLSDYSVYLEGIENAKGQIEEKGGYAKLSFTAPFKPANHNADDVSEDGKTISWNAFLIKSKESLHVEYSIVPLALIAGGVLVGIAAVVVGTVVIVKVAKKKKLANSEQPAPAEN